MKTLMGWLLFVGLAVGAGIALSLKPWQVYGDERAKADRMVEEMRDLEQSRADLLSRKARIESPTGREELAREAGYRRQDERPILLKEDRP